MSLNGLRHNSRTSAPVAPDRTTGGQSLVAMQSPRSTEVTPAIIEQPHPPAEPTVASAPTDIDSDHFVYLSRFGKRLVTEGFTTTEQVWQAEVESRRSDRLLLDILEDRLGSIPDSLRQQYKHDRLLELSLCYGVAAFDPDQQPLGIELLRRNTGQWFSLSLCRQYQCFPIEVDRQSMPPKLVLAMVNPDQLEPIDRLTESLKPRGMELHRRVILPEDCDRLINLVQHTPIRSEAQTSGHTSSATADVALEELSATSATVDNNPVISLVNKILVKALRQQVSELKLEVGPADVKVQGNRDGQWREIFPALPLLMYQSVYNQFKRLAGLELNDATETAVGRFRRLFQGQPIDFLLRLRQTQPGQQIHLKILRATTIPTLDRLLHPAKLLNQVQQSLTQPHGLFLVAAPAKEGKTTLLTALLLAARQETGTWFAIEQPIEYELPGIVQLAVGTAVGQTAVDRIRYAVSQNPTGIMLSELGDRETALAALAAAENCLVIAGVSASSSADALRYLQQLQVEQDRPLRLLGILSQRLLRRLCSACRVSDELTPAILARYGLSLDQNHQPSFYRAVEAFPNDRIVCPSCRGLGYQGRLGIYEFLPMDQTLQSFLMAGIEPDSIIRAAMRRGMTSLLAQSLQKVYQGETTLAEVDRTTFNEAALTRELSYRREADPQIAIVSESPAMVVADAIESALTSAAPTPAPKVDVATTATELLLRQELTEIQSQLVATQQRLQMLEQAGQGRLKRHAIADVDVAEQLLAVMGCFDHVDEQILPMSRQEGEIQRHYHRVRHLLVSKLKHLGVIAIDCKGQLLDFRSHQLAMWEVCNDVPAGTIIGEIQRGYQLDDHILRPAIVIAAIPSIGDPST